MIIIVIVMARTIIKVIMKFCYIVYRCDPRTGRVVHKQQQ
jgi:hypothetical protein